MKTQSLMFLVGVLLCTSAFAQSGTWTREGTWKVPSEHASVVFNNKIWITGGTNERGYDYESIRCSTDGTNWTNAGQAPWGARVGHTLAVLNGRIWLMGGRDANYVRQNDVWSSADGVNWTQETAAAPRRAVLAVAAALPSGSDSPAGLHVLSPWHPRNSHLRIRLPKIPFSAVRFPPESGICRQAFRRPARFSRFPPCSRRTLEHIL